jgi:hypothetical protein
MCIERHGLTRHTGASEHALIDTLITEKVKEDTAGTRSNEADLRNHQSARSESQGLDISVPCWQHPVRHGLLSV